MPIITLGNTSVIETSKKDDELDLTPGNIVVARRADLGQRVTTMSLNEVDGDDRPSRAMNLALAARIWSFHSDEDPAWVDGDDELLVELIADHYGCPIGRPDDWTEG